MTGFEVISRIRQEEIHRTLPIILVTALRGTEDRIRGIEAGCDDFISKPIDKMELLARIRSLLKVKAYNDLMNNYRNELESEVAKRTEELIIKEKQLNQSEKLANLGKLTSAIAHEIRQPLNSIKILTDGVLFWNREKQKTSYEEMIENFEDISKFVNKIDGIIKNLKLMINSPEKIETGLFNVNNIIKDVLNLYGQKLKDHSIIVVESFDENIDEFTLSEQQFQQVIINLVENAIHALGKVDKKDKKISIETKELTNKIIIRISDNGTGISNENKSKIFEPFFTTRQDIESMGMGLFVVKNILKTINSNIIVKDNNEGSAIFEIELNRSN
jgi:C4-dicarboxylate-specific signal transduction histidine kinase